jgi:hypothetical protein
MTASGQRASAENVAAPKPTTGPGHADATTPLPDGWASFCSLPDRNFHARWYATAPWDVEKIQAAASDELRDIAGKLFQTVDASTWPKLHAVVSAQVALYALLTDGETL